MLGQGVFLFGGQNVLQELGQIVLPFIERRLLLGVSFIGGSSACGFQFFCGILGKNQAQCVCKYNMMCMLFSVAVFYCCAL